MSAGVYVVYLSGTPYAYVGESSNIELRWRRHVDEWVWPNVAEYVIARLMPKSSRRERQHTESALIRLLRGRGFWVLGMTASEAGSHNRKKANARRNPAVRRATINAAHAGITEESFKKRSKSLKDTYAKRTATWFANRNKRAWETRRARYGTNGTGKISKITKRKVA